MAVQPSVNADGFVVFRARSTGSEGGGESAAAAGGPVRGIFTRDMAQRLAPGPISTVAVNGSAVPAPNNLDATFNEFPSIPRIDRLSRTIATRGQSSPVWEYVIGPDLTTRVGTSGVYATLGGTLQTGANLLGAVTDCADGHFVFAHFQVPGAAPGTRFDQFPGAPGVAGASTVAFKGNWTDLTNPAAPVGRTGVYYRDLADPTNSVQRVADSRTLIPGTSVAFASTAPPSADGRYMVFVGLDNEESPTRGGVSRARMSPVAALRPRTSVRGRPVGDLSETPSPCIRRGPRTHHTRRVASALTPQASSGSSAAGSGAAVSAMSPATGADESVFQKRYRRRVGSRRAIATSPAAPFAV